jgi:hypothetical protein
VYFLVTTIAAAAAAVAYAYHLSRLRRGDKFRETLGPDIHPKTIAALLKEGAEGELAQDGLWLKENARELAERFGSQWVAVVHKEVVAVSRSEDEVWAAAKSAWPALTPFVRWLRSRWD